VQFVDNTSHFLNKKGIKPYTSLSTTDRELLASYTSKNAQLWFDLQWVSGGQINLSKCFYYAFKPSINYKSNKISYTKLSFDDGIKVRNRSTGTVHTIQDLPPNEARRTLGVMMSPDGNGSTQIKLSTKKAREYFSKFITSSLSQKTKWVAITSVIEPSIIYPLLTTSFSPKDIKPLDSLTSQMKCLALGLNRKFPRAILHGPLSLGGIGIPSTSQKNTKDRLNYFLYNMRCPSPIHNKLDITLIYSQIEIGSFCQFFQLPFILYGHLPSSSFCVQLLSELEPKGIILQPVSQSIWTPTPLYDGDQAIMEIAIQNYGANLFLSVTYSFLTPI
jgi:hypothetical protein